jgi:hypothetical protein
LLIAGVYNGIGKAIVKEFYKSNYNIMINDVQPNELKKIDDNIPKAFKKIIIIMILKSSIFMAISLSQKLVDHL